MSDFHQTKRDCVPELEGYLGKDIKVLDKGFIRLIDYMGSDAAIVQAARVSYGKGTKKRNEDNGLIRYLMRHRHSTPFEMCEIKLHVKLPIFVARQWVRHRTANINEYSARYSVLEQEFYIPAQENLTIQDSQNKQGREEGSPLTMLDLEETITENGEQAYKNYESMLEKGLARELARMTLPINIYTQWYWKIDLHNLLHFIALRNDPHAQYEIRAYAEAIAEIVKKWVPMSYAAFEDYVINGAKLSVNELALTKALLKGENTESIMGKMSQRELQEFNRLMDMKNQTTKKPSNKGKKTPSVSTQCQLPIKEKKHPLSQRNTN